MRKQIAKALSLGQFQRGEGKILLDTAKRCKRKQDTAEAMPCYLS